MISIMSRPTVGSTYKCSYGLKHSCSRQWEEIVFACFLGTMKKAFDQTARDIKIGVNKKVLKVHSMEQKFLMLLVIRLGVLMDLFLLILHSLQETIMNTR
ncbi:unnamed protein product [Lactuca virosa]|uniref:Uncharacterized protein n=1 Tax=Lactuca virosa TaxID=75947 RepID=A0AAU9LJU4_9ASTR|nr:unnamed protein product [Lactuca virosa]